MGMQGIGAGAIASVGLHMKCETFSFERGGNGDSETLSNLLKALWLVHDRAGTLPVKQ